MSAKNANQNDFFSTHPSDSKRIAAMNQLIVEIENDPDFHSKPVIGNNSQESKSTSEVIYCTNCGAQIDADSKFCTNCGTKL